MPDIRSSPARIVAFGHVKQSTLDLALQKLFRDLQVAHLDDIVGEQLTFDFSRATWFDLGALLWLLPVLSRLRLHANAITLQLPDPDSSRVSGTKLWGAMIRWRFFDALNACVDDPVNLLPPSQHHALTELAGVYRRSLRQSARGDAEALERVGRIEIRVISLRSNDDDAEVRSIIDGYSDVVLLASLRLECGWSEGEAQEFAETIVPHAVTNVQHSKGSFALVSSRVDQKNLTFTVCDNGIGIPGLLRSALSTFVASNEAKDSALIKYFAEQAMIEDSIKSILDSEFVVASTAENVTSEPRERLGLGLYYLKRLVLRKGGELRIRSGRAVVTFSQDEVTATDDLVDSPGTSIRVLLPRARPGRSRKRAAAREPARTVLP